VLKRSCGKAALEKATEEVEDLAWNQENKNRLFNEEGLLEGLARVIKKSAKAFMKSRVCALGTLIFMTYYCSDEQIISLYNVPG